MKRVVSVVLTLVMIISMFTSVSARTLDSMTSYVPNPMELELAVEVLARESGSDGEYQASLAVLDIMREKGIDYKATLDMSTIRALFDKEFVRSVLGTDADAQSEFNSGVVTTRIEVAINYPENAIINRRLTSTSVGTLDAGIIFSEKTRRTVDNGLIVTYVNKSNLTVEELLNNKDTYLKDIAFVLNDAIAYDDEGTHRVSVTLSGSTTIAFNSKTQVVNYIGGSSHLFTYTEKLLDHVLQVVPLVPSTCDAEGTSEGVKCITHNDAEHGYGYGCGANGIVVPTTLPRLEHSKVNVAEVAATCVKTGVAAHEMCLLCKADFVGGVKVSHESLILPITGVHLHPQTIPGTPATCVKDGLTDGIKCLDCGTVTTPQSKIPATNHEGTKVTIPGAVATCTEDGLTAGEKCTECNVVLVSQKIIPATGHNFGEWNVISEATETATGLKERICANDPEHKETVIIPKLAHTHVEEPKMAVVTKAATCTEQGIIQKYCSCGATMGTESTPALGHKMSHITAVAATCTVTGTVEHYSCANCNKNFRDEAGKKEIKSTVEPKNPNNHGGNVVTIPGFASTCVTKGLTDGEKCKACNKVLTPQTITDVIKDALQEVSEVPAECEKNGVAHHLHCKICNKDFVEEDGKYTVVEMADLKIPATGHKYGELQITTEPTEDSVGEGKYVCQNDASHEKTTVIAKLAHVHNEIVEETLLAPTCVENGKKRRVFTCCGTIDEEYGIKEIVALGHTPVLIHSVDPTCYSTGVKAHWQCSVCKTLFANSDMTKVISEPEITEKVNHNFVFLNDHVKKCTFCNEVVNIKKVNTDKADVKSHGGIKNDVDRLREEVMGEAIKTEANISIEELEEVSAELSNELPEDASEEKLVLDIKVEKVTEYFIGEETEAVDTDIEYVDETDDLIEIEITIPESMRDKKDFMVHRRHIDKNGVEYLDQIKTRRNEFGEYMEISSDKTMVTIHVKRFSEYVLVGYETRVNPVENTSGGGSSAYYTVVFHANGGTVIENLTVKSGTNITAPVSVRDGYVFAGWYTDLNFTNLFEFSTKITGNVVLYAKWVLDECGGTKEDGCPCLDFVDLDPQLWYHKGVDYVLNNELMKGIGDAKFAPDMSLSRAMLVTILWRVEGSPEMKDETTFEDLEKASYYEDAVAWAAKEGVVKGYTDVAFGPNDNISREQIATIMHRYAKYKGYEVETFEGTDILSYTDASDVSDYATTAMKYAVGSGLINGKSETTLDPKSDASRAEAATILMRFLESNKH